MIIDSRAMITCVKLVELIDKQAIRTVRKTDGVGVNRQRTAAKATKYKPRLSARRSNTQNPRYSPLRKILFAFETVRRVRQTDR